MYNASMILMGFSAACMIAGMFYGVGLFVVGVCLYLASLLTLLAIGGPRA